MIQEYCNISKKRNSQTQIVNDLRLCDVLRKRNSQTQIKIDSRVLWRFEETEQSDLNKTFFKRIVTFQKDGTVRRKLKMIIFMK